MTSTNMWVPCQQGVPVQVLNIQGTRYTHISHKLIFSAVIQSSQFSFIFTDLRAPPLIVHRPVRTSFFQSLHVTLVGASVTMREGFLWGNQRSMAHVSPKFPSHVAFCIGFYTSGGLRFFRHRHSGLLFLSLCCRLCCIDLNVLTRRIGTQSVFASFYIFLAQFPIKPPCN